MNAARVLRPLLGVLAAAAVGAAGCGVPEDRSAKVIPAEEVPYDLLDRTTTSLRPAVDAGQDTTICLSIDGQLLTVGRARSGSRTLDDPRALVIAGPTEGEAELGLRSALDEDAIEDVSVDGDEARVELGEGFSELPGDQQLLAVAQATCTLTTQPGVARVVFVLDGERVDVPIQGGSLVSRAVTRADYRRLLVN